MDVPETAGDAADAVFGGWEGAGATGKLRGPPRKGAPTRAKSKRDSSLHMPTISQERDGKKKRRPAPLRGCDFFCAIECVCGYKECMSYPGAGEAAGEVRLRKPERRQMEWGPQCTGDLVAVGCGGGAGWRGGCERGV